MIKKFLMCGVDVEKELKDCLTFSIKKKMLDRDSA